MMDYESDIVRLDENGKNSTIFTACCEISICSDQKRCPSCGILVVGHYLDCEYQRRKYG
jgi:hypothetical protein